VEANRLLGRKLQLQVDTGALPPAAACRTRFASSMPYAVTNLLRNAIKYARTRIRVSARSSTARSQVHVDDDGIGIPVEERERVFSAFTRLDRSRDRSTGGYGLGLAIARLVLEQHNGTRQRRRESPLGGARFTLSWPLSQNVTES
jgi:signal transduction histidine kinase